MMKIGPMYSRKTMRRMETNKKKCNKKGNKRLDREHTRKYTSLKSKTIMCWGEEEAQRKTKRN